MAWREVCIPKAWNNVRNYCDIFRHISHPTGGIQTLVEPKGLYEQGCSGSDNFIYFSRFSLPDIWKKARDSIINVELHYHQNNVQFNVVADSTVASV